MRARNHDAASAIKVARDYSPGCEIVNVRHRCRRITRGGAMPNTDGNRPASYYRALAAVSA